MHSTTRDKLNTLKGFNLFYAAKHVCKMTPRYQSIAEGAGLAQAVVSRREDKAAKRAKTKAQRQSRKRNRR